MNSSISNSFGSIFKEVHFEKLSDEMNQQIRRFFSTDQLEFGDKLRFRTEIEENAWFNSETSSDLYKNSSKPFFND